jgi:NADH-quinone oxidoreductase subunit J
VNALLYISGLVAVISTLMVITRKNAVHALLYLIVSLLSVALVFFILGAPFAAALEVIVYAGAIMVLFVFVIMMLNAGADAAEQERQWLSPAGWVGPACLSTVLLGELVYVLAGSSAKIIRVSMVAPKQVGVSLFGPYFIGVELASILLLSGLIGAYHLGRPQQPTPPPLPGGDRVLFPSREGTKFYSPLGRDRGGFPSVIEELHEKKQDRSRP